MRISVIAIYVVAVFSTSACLYAQDCREPAEPNIVISEICFWPNEGESEWVELKNISPNSVDISGWQITNGQGFTFVFPDLLQPMPSQAHALVKFDGQESALNDLFFDGDNLIVVHGPNEIPGLSDPNDPNEGIFGDLAEGECAVYTSGSKDKTTIRGFVAWGDDRVPSSPSMRHALDGSVLRFPARRLYVKGYLYGGVSHKIQKGESLGLYGSNRGRGPEEWMVYALDDTTPGSENILLEPGLFKRGATSYIFVERPIYISWRPVPGATSYQVQVCADIECANIIKEETVSSENTSYLITENPSAGTNYYARVRAVGAQGEVSRWTNVHEYKAVKRPSWVPNYNIQRGEDPNG